MHGFFHASIALLVAHAACASPSTPVESNSPDLAAWVLAHGGQVNSVEIAEPNGVRGLFTTAPVAKDAELVVVPRALLSCADSDALESPLVSELIEQKHSLPPSPLHLWLLDELKKQSDGQESRFIPWLSSLPTLEDMAGFPSFFSDDRLGKIEGTWLGRALASQTTQWNTKEFATYRENVTRLQNVEQAAYVRAHLLAASRAARLRLADPASPEDAEKVAAVTCFIPFVDMINHQFSPHHTAVWKFDAARDALVVTALADMAAGEELLADYGAISPTSFVMHYGFLPSDHPDVGETIVELIVGEQASPDDAEELQAMKRKVITNYCMHAVASGTNDCVGLRQQHGELVASMRLSAFLDHRWTQRTLSMLRFLVATNNDLVAYHRLQGGKQLDLWAMGPLSVINEARALDYLVECIDKGVEAFASTLEDDAAALDATAAVLKPAEDSPAPTAEQKAGALADEALYGSLVLEKSILKEYVQMIDMVVPLFDLSCSELCGLLELDCEEIQEPNSATVTKEDVKRYEHYVSNVVVPLFGTCALNPEQREQVRLHLERLKAEKEEQKKQQETDAAAQQQAASSNSPDKTAEEEDEEEVLAEVDSSGRVEPSE